jgi:hypothetical protein
MPTLLHSPQCECSQSASAIACSLVAGDGIAITGSPAAVNAISGGAWTNYTHSITNVTTGNALQQSRYLQVGKTLDVMVAVQFGSTTSFSAGRLDVDLPGTLAPKFGGSLVSANHVRGYGGAYDASAARWFQGYVHATTNSNPLSMMFKDDSFGTFQWVSNTQPFTWTNGDRLVMRVRIRLA